MSDLAAGRTQQGAFRVLIVDDDPDMAGFLARLLKQQGMQAEIAGDGATALATIAAEAPDLVLLDVQMPGQSGFDICRRLKSSEATALLPVVLVTALEDHESRVRGIEGQRADAIGVADREGLTEERAVGVAVQVDGAQAEPVDHRREVVRGAGARVVVAARTEAAAAPPRGDGVGDREVLQVGTRERGGPTGAAKTPTPKPRNM